ncbi:hypothetical protein RDI58_000927 [Solanum bulbocastanum]|uniref:Uncharacterized protein n=1 Tax=Solanum bulbocastanum TaxID=147425 RepID=A0AAN8YMQ9_SOLBU
MSLLQPNPYDSPLGFHRSINGVAFGFDSISNDYKIIRQAEVCGEPPFYCCSVIQWRVENYELSIDSWRDVDHRDLPLPYVHCMRVLSCFTKALHIGLETRLFAIIKCLILVIPETESVMHS